VRYNKKRKGKLMMRKKEYTTVVFVLMNIFVGEV
jgi:hypothetical protein